MRLLIGSGVEAFNAEAFDTGLLIAFDAVIASGVEAFNARAFNTKAVNSFQCESFQY
jgi:hypothetical protein